MGKLFGTDGIRGVANTELTPELALALGSAAASTLRNGAKRPKVVLGRDTRVSGDMLASAMAAGFLSAGVDVVRGRVLPTPAVAYLVRKLGCAAGAVISASHNPMQDNGIKFFGPDGFKLSDAQEEEIERSLTVERPRPTGPEVGRLHFVPEADDLYISHALEALEGRSLEGLKVVIDCANGAAHSTSPEAFRRAGAQVWTIGCEPNGININLDCGSLFPEKLAQEVLNRSAHLGLSHDGDADRLIAVDESGRIVDGDQMLAALAIELKDQGRLPGDLVASTIMANLGFHRSMQQAGIEVIETAVGDRFVIEAMRKNGASVGGEQSGHLIFLDFSTTGDGLVTGLRLAGLMASSRKPLSEIAAVVQRYPQSMINVRVVDKARLIDSEGLWQAVEDAKSKLGANGRVLVRPSGTEPLVRVMVEAEHPAQADEIAQHLADVVKEHLGEYQAAKT